MSALSSLNVSLTRELEAFIRDRVAAGYYATSSEVVREGLRLLQAREREADESLAALKAKLQRASDEADRGEFVDGATFLADLRARLLRGELNRKDGSK